MRLSAKQIDSVRRSTSRTNLWEGAVRSGKTIASLFRWIRFVGREAPKGVPLALIGKTERTLKDNILEPLCWMLGRNFSYSPGLHEATLFDRKCLLYGANDLRAEGKIRGLTLGGAYGDELTLWPESFWKMLLSRCSPEGAKIFGTTNPDSPYHWLKTGTIDRVNELDLSVFHFDIDDNPFLPRSFVEALKVEYTGVWYKRFITGLWVLAEGAIYDFFVEEEPYVIDKPPRASYYVVGVDYGSQNPCTFGLMGINPQTKPKVWTEREYWYCGRDTGRTKTDSEYADDFVAWLGGTKIQAVYCDPSARSFIAELQRRNFFCIDPDTSVIDGLRLQARMLKLGDYAVCSTCTHTINEYFTYVWDQKQGRKGVDAPLKQNDHSKDRERYVLQSKFGPNAVDYAALTTL